MGLRVTKESLLGLPAFRPLVSSDDRGGSNVEHRASIPKTGLGSSAALVSSIVGAVLQGLRVSDVASRQGLEELHGLAQIAHCRVVASVA